jgi:hypothetical protein
MALVPPVADVADTFDRIGCTASIPSPRAAALDSFVVSGRVWSGFQAPSLHLRPRTRASTSALAVTSCALNHDDSRLVSRQTRQK